MEGPRAPTNAEFPELVEFLDKNLRQGMTDGWSIAEEYPTAVTPHNLENFRIIKDDEKILSHALTKPVLCKTRRGIFKVGCIGSVVTRDEYRNQGLSQTIIRDCLTNLTAQNCDIAILWTNLFDFYRKLGFELAGSEISLVVEKPLGIPPAFRVMQNNRVDPQALFRLYGQHTVNSVRTLEDFEKYLKIPNCRLYTAWAADGKLEAYAVEGKGSDLQGYIHEWGGSVDGIVALVDHIRKEQNKTITLITPTHSQALIRKLESLGARKVEGFLGMIKIIQPQALFNKVIRNARQEWGINNFVLEYRDGFYYYGVGTDLFKTDRESDIVRLLFGPLKPSQLHDNGAEINTILDRMLPLEMWIWGWDSI